MQVILLSFIINLKSIIKAIRMVKFKRKLIKFIVNALKFVTIQQYFYFNLFTKINFVINFMQLIMFINIIIKFKVMDFMVEFEIIVMFLFLVVSQMHFQIKDE